MVNVFELALIAATLCTDLLELPDCVVASKVTAPVTNPGAVNFAGLVHFFTSLEAVLSLRYY